MNCIFCDKPSKHVKFMGIPGHIMVPNSYCVCDDHKDKHIWFSDVYNEDGTRKPWPFTKEPT